MYQVSVPASPTLGLLVLSTLVGVIVAITAWGHRDKPGAVPLAALMASMTAWGSIYAVGLVTHDPGNRRLLEQLLWIGVATSPVAWFVFALEYTGHSSPISRRTVAALLVVPVISFALVMTNASHHLVWASHEVLTVNGLAIARQEYGPWFWVFAIYSYGLILVGALFLVRLVVTAKTLYADQALALVVGAIAPTIANVVSVLGLSPLPGLDMTPYALAISGITCAYAIGQYRLFDFAPATRRLGRDAVVDNMRDAVVIVDDERIIELNAAAATAFDTEPTAALGEPVETLLGSETAVPPPDEAREVSGGHGARTYELRAAPIENWQGRPVGHVLVLRDVTERVLRQQRLSVLNRILRHNLRNDMNVVKARADRIQGALDGEDAEHAATISETATDLVELSEKARAFDRVVDEAAGETPVDLVEVVRSSATAVREEFRHVPIEVSTTGSHRITCPNPELIGLVVDNLLENAAEHNDATDPWVDVVVEGHPSNDGGDVVITVTDNGPPIPDNELTVLDSNAERPLVHGTGIGLWTAHWCVRRLGGALGFDRRDERGNVVTVEIPVAPPTSETVGSSQS